MAFSFAFVACGPNCWEARDSVCRCSCGGKYHGIQRRAPVCESVAPRRQMVWEDYLWELVKVAAPVPMGEGVFAPERLNDEARKLNSDAGILFMDAHRARKFYGNDFPVAIVRPFTDSQIAKWGELSAWRMPHIAPSSFALYGKPEGLWRRMDELTARVKMEMARASAGMQHVAVAS